MDWGTIIFSTLSNDHGENDYCGAKRKGIPSLLLSFQPSRDGQLADSVEIWELVRCAAGAPFCCRSFPLGRTLRTLTDTAFCMTRVRAQLQSNPKSFSIPFAPGMDDIVRELFPESAWSALEVRDKDDKQGRALALAPYVRDVGGGGDERIR